ncbi:MAG: substrate-binding domain-containing protein, partial [Deltaproteobacteria bacterium]|nr:substrate-binding domain-containing protein [Deltaproteobacteria bacterium]
MGSPFVPPLPRSKVPLAAGFARRAAVAVASVALVVTAGTIVGAGCDRDRDRKKDGSGSAGASYSTDAPAAPTPTGKLLRIAMIAKTSANPSYLSARTGAEDRARELSLQVGAPIEVNWMTPSQEDGQVQAQRILQAVNERVDAILISCSDDQKVSDAIDDAVARGVAVMTFDSDAPRSRRFAHCGVDDVALGEKLMAELAAVLAPVSSPAKDSGSGMHGPRKTPVPLKVAVLAGNRAALNLRGRVQGALNEAARHPELKVVGTFFHAETAQDASAQVLRTMAAHPDIAGWAMVGGWPLFNKTLLAELEAPGAGKRNSAYKIVSVNALPPQQNYVEKAFAPVLLAQPTYL